MKKLIAMLLICLSITLIIGCCMAQGEFTLSQAISPGDRVTFGVYEQDNDTSHGKEPLTWIVLQRQGNKILVITEYIIDYQPYDTYSEKGVWGKSSIRDWLNDRFMQSAFTDSERSAILTVNIDNSARQNNPEFKAGGSKNTTDQVFLLSYAEVVQFWPAKSDRRAKFTAYAWSQGVSDYYSTYKGYSSWYLRSPGYNDKCAAQVIDTGTIGDEYIHRQYGDGIRPALWIDTNLLP